MQNLKKTVRWLIIRDNTWLAIGLYLFMMFIWAMISLNPKWGVASDTTSSSVQLFAAWLALNLLVPTTILLSGVAISSLWTRDWPERYIMSAQELLKTNPELANVLTPLIEECERTGNGGDIKEWLNGHRELGSARQEIEGIIQELNKEKERRERQAELQAKASDLVTRLGLPI